MLNPTQRNAIFSGVPTTLDGTTVHLMRKDRQTDPIAYPALRMSILTQNTKTASCSTGGPIQKYYDEYGEAQQYYGDFRRATLNIMIECMSPISGTDSATLTELDRLTFALVQQIRFYGLELYYPTDEVKILNILAVVPLPSFFDEKQHRWIYRCSIDTLLEYTFKMLDPRDNIRSIDWDFGIDPHWEPEPTTDAHILLSETHAPSYVMDTILIREVGGNLWDQTMDVILTTLPERESTQTMNVIISW